MKKVIVYIVIGFIVSSCATTKIIETAKFQELEYGICSVEIKSQKSFKGSPTNQRAISNNFEWVKQTNDIEAKLGTSFGISYKVLTEKNGKVPLKMIWIFPTTMHSSINNTNYDKLEYII